MSPSSARADQLREAREVDVAARNYRHDLRWPRSAIAVEVAAATAQAAAPSAITCTRSATSFIAARDVVEPDDDRVRDAGHAEAATSSRAPSGRLRRRRTTASTPRNGSPGPRRATPRAARPFGLGRVDPCFGPQRPQPDRYPGEQPAAAQRRDNGIDVRQIFEDLQRDRAVSADEVVVVERVHEMPRHAVGAVVLDGSPALVERGLDDRGARAARWRCSLVSGAVSMTSTLQVAPARRAARATPCAALPALTVQTPPARSAGASGRRRCARR